MTRSRSTATNPAKSQRGKSGLSKKQSRVLNKHDDDENPLGGTDKKLGSKLFDMPGVVLDMCFGVDVGLELRDYVALAGTCRFFRDRFSDEVWQDLYFHFRQHPSKSSSLPLEYRDPISTLPASSRVPNFVHIFDRLPRSPSAPIKHYRPPGDRSTWTINQYLTYKRARAAAKDKMLYELREEERCSQTRVKLEEGVVWYHGSKRDRAGLIPAKNRGRAADQKTVRKGKAMESEQKLAGGDVGVGEGSPGAGSAGRVKTSISAVPVIDLTGDGPDSEVGITQQTAGQDRERVVPVIDLTVDEAGTDETECRSAGRIVSPVANGITKSRSSFKRSKCSPDRADQHSSTSARSRSSSGSKTPDLRALFFKPVPAETDESDLELTRQTTVFVNGEYKKDPWKSVWRERVVWAVNHTVVEKKVAKKKFRLTDKDLAALKQELILYRCKDSSKPKAMINLAAAEALAVRVHGGYLGYLAVLNKHELTLQKSADTRRRNQIAKDWVEAQAEANAEEGEGGDGVTDNMAEPESEMSESDDDEADVHLDGGGCACDVCRAQELGLGVGYWE